MRLVIIAALAAAGSALACGTEGTEGTRTGTDGRARADSGDTREVQIALDGSRVSYVALATASVVTPTGDPKSARDWDLALDGTDVFTNGGATASGHGAALGPFPEGDFATSAAPPAPFLIRDAAGSAFLGWGLYDPSAHVLWSRYHVYGVREGSRLWKVQILSYYGKRDGAVVPALYRMRYAEVAEGATAHEIEDLDGSAGDLAEGTARGECLDLGTGARTVLSPAEALASAGWHLCVRRDSVQVNGGISGPRGVTAVDLDASTQTESLDAVKGLTAEGEAARFEAAGAASFEGKAFRGDRIVSAFSDKWMGPPATWLVQDAGGAKKYFLQFTHIRRSETGTPELVTARVKPLEG